MNWIRLMSSNLDAAAYDDANCNLYIRFKHGGVYEYSGVPRHIYDGLLSALSKGKYHAAYIKYAYPYRRL